jgi:predicted RNase H-like HicB family nuclease
VAFSRAKALNASGECCERCPAIIGFVTGYEKRLAMRQVILIPDETGGYIVEVPSLPGCYSQGKTEAEALANIKEAIDLHIEDMLAAGEEVPDDVPDTILLKAV